MDAIPDVLKSAFADRLSLPPRETARLLGLSEKTLRSHAAVGNIRYLEMGLGGTRRRREFTLADIMEFLETMRRRECPSTSRKTRRSTTTISNGAVVGFMARREKLIAERQRRSSAPKDSA